MFRFVGRVVTVVLCVLAVLAGGAAYLYRRELVAFAGLARSSDQQTVTYVLARGTTPREVATQLQALGVVADGDKFYRWMRYVAKNDHTLRAGTYELSPSMTPEQLVAVMQTGRQVEAKFTVPEGLSKDDIAVILEKAGFGAKETFKRAMSDPALIAEFGVPSTGAGGQDAVPGGLEGYLFPDTYRFLRGTEPEVILRRMRARLDEVVGPRLKRRMAQLGWDLHRTLTLASIIEKETGARVERPHISSVFHNRLRKRMKLQTDPTVIYGVADHDGDIKRSDLQREHPYNTYVIPGLPPGPIAQPGRAAIEAALFPSDDDDLFFVAMGDTGRHVFCPTLECHEAAVQKWQVEFYERKRAGLPIDAAAFDDTGSADAAAGGGEGVDAGVTAAASPPPPAPASPTPSPASPSTP